METRDTKVPVAYNDKVLVFAFITCPLQVRYGFAPCHLHSRPRLTEQAQSECDCFLGSGKWDVANYMLTCKAYKIST